MARFLIAATVWACATITPALSQPAEVLQFHEKMGGGSLSLTFCLIGSHVCVDRKAIAFGQVCDSELAKRIGTGASGEYEGFVPFGFHYAGFSCGAGYKWHPKTDHIFGGGNWMN